MFEKYLSIKGKKETLFTIIIYDKDNKFFVTDIEQKLKNIQKMKDNFRRQIINDRLYNLKCFLEKKNKENDKINSVILCGEEIEMINLDKPQIKVLKEYNIINYNFIYDDHFHVKFVNDLFYDFNFYYSIHIGKNITYYKINSSKKKKIQEDKFNLKDCISKIENFLDKNKEKVIIHGNSQINKKIDHKFILEKYNDYKSDEEIVICFQNIDIKEKQKEFKKYISNLHDTSIENKLIYGLFEKEIIQEIENYSVKKLFVHKDFENHINELDNSLLNFELIIIDTLTNNDPGYELKNNYGGFFGIKYY
tara:strand:- start:2151 stop:3071 length:921 start_codon:yes stop_codon:yes gene_type:complete